MPITPADQALLDAGPAPAVPTVGPDAPIGSPSGPAGPTVPIGVTPAPAVAAPVVAPPAADVALPAPVEGPPAAVPAQAQAPIPPELQDIRDAAAAQAAAADEEGAAKKAQDDARAQAEADARVQHEADAAEAEEMRQVHARAATDAENQTQQALIAARDRKIPDFWEGREGARTSAALLVGLGGAAAALLGSSKNGAADIIQGNVDAYYRRQKEQVDNLYKYAAAKGRSEDDLRMRQAAELAELQVQHGATNLAIADHINEILQASQGRIDVATANQLKAKLVEDGEKSVLAGRETLARINLQGMQGQLAMAKAAKATRAGTGGVGSGEAYDAFKAAVVGAADPNNIPDLGKLAAAAHIKPKEIAGQVKQIREEAALEKTKNAGAETAGNKAEGYDPNLVVRVGGKDVGLASSSRNVKAIEDRFANYIDAIKALKELRASGNFTPSGDIYKRAALAVAATTTANASDHTTAMESGTLANSVGIVNNESIDRQLKHTIDRFEEFKGQLRPIPESKSGGATGKGVDPELLRKARAAASDSTRAPAVSAAAQKIIDQAAAGG